MTILHVTQILMVIYINGETSYLATIEKCFIVSIVIYFRVFVVVMKVVFQNFHTEFIFMFLL